VIWQDREYQSWLSRAKNTEKRQEQEKFPSDTPGEAYAALTTRINKRFDQLARFRAKWASNEGQNKT
jgi:hypothetical protein